MSNKLFEVPRDEPTTPLFQRRESSSHDSGKTLKLITRSRILIVVAIIVAVMVVLTVVLAVSISSSNKDKGNDSCAIPGACDSQVLAYIDTRFDPCEDFFNYSCGKWLSANPLGSLSQLTMFDEVAINNLIHLKQYLSRPIVSSDPEAIKKSKYFFSACTDTSYIEHNLQDYLIRFMTTAGGWEDVGIFPADEWDFDNLTDDHYIGSPAYFAFGVTPDDLNSSKPVIKIHQSGLSMSLDSYEDEAKLMNLTDTISGLLQELLGNKSLDNYDEIAHGIAYYEKSLAQYWLTNTELRNYTLQYNPMSLRELSELFPMDWVNYFNRYFNRAGFSGDLTEDSVVILQNVNYFISFNFTLTRDAVNYAKWQLVLGEFRNYASTIDSFKSDILHKIEYPVPPELGASNEFTCANLVQNSMPLAVARPFVEEFITRDLINTVNETANQIEKAFIQRVMGKDWLDQTTKNRCVEKVNAITRQIAYPDFIKTDEDLNKYYDQLDISNGHGFFEVIAAVRYFHIQGKLSSYTKPIDKTQWLKPPTAVNAYYSPQFNQFVFLAGILRPPFIAATWPPFLLYGAFGVVTGHELTHGFDDQGQQFDKNGNHVKWWTDESIRQFQNRTQCFVDQYDQYSLLGVEINGELTLGENIADNGGVHTAYHAYKNVMNGTKAQSYGGHTEDQLFFVSFAQVYCSKYTVDALETLTTTDTHSPNPIRVLGSLVNSEEFAKAFRCSKGSKMYPTDDRCELW